MPSHDSEDRDRAGEHPDDSPETILLIGGHGALCVDVCRRRTARYRLLEAADTTVGRRLARRHRPDLVIRGAALSRLDGYVACRGLAEAPPPLSDEDRLFLERLEKVIAEHLGDDAFATDELARQTATSRTQLYGRLRRLLARSPAELIMERRLEHAAQWLADGVDSVSEVAFGVGFKSVSHFSRRFHQRYGVRPSKLLRRDREAGLPALQDILEGRGHGWEDTAARSGRTGQRSGRSGQGLESRLASLRPMSQPLPGKETNMPEKHDEPTAAEDEPVHESAPAENPPEEDAAYQSYPSVPDDGNPGPSGGG